MNMKDQEKSDSPVCKHCRGAKYVLPYWLEKMLERQGMHMTDIPPDAFKMIPVEHLLYCHCYQSILTFGRKDPNNHCLECDGSTWRFTQTGKDAGYCRQKVMDLSPDEIRTLHCEYFERCPCDCDEQGPKKAERKKTLKDILDLLNIKIPRPGLSFGHG